MTRIDPRRPESNPGYRAALERGRENLPRLKFENDAQRRDYMKAVTANPNNVPGLPVFYPPERVRPIFMSEDVRDFSDEMFLEHLRQDLIKDGELFCGPCDRITTFSFGKGYSFCKRCGTTFTISRRVRY